MHEAGQAEKPGRRHPVLALAVTPADDQLGHVDDEPGGVTQQEHDHDADQHGSQVYFIVGRTIAI